MLLDTSRSVCQLLLWAAGGSVFPPDDDDEAYRTLALAQLEVAAFGELYQPRYIATVQFLKRYALL